MSDYSITLGAGGEQEIQNDGRFWHILEATGEVGLSFNAGPNILRSKGQGGEMLAGFQRIRVSSATAQTIKVYFGLDPIQNERTEVNVSTTATISPGNTLDNGGDVSLPAVASTAVRGADANQLAVILKADIANTDTIRVGTSGVGAAQGYPLEPGESVTIATTAAIAAYNPNAAAQNVHVLPVRNV